VQAESAVVTNQVGVRLLVVDHIAREAGCPAAIRYDCLGARGGWRVRLAFRRRSRRAAATSI